ncbi:Alpha/Beta hydrolase protein [Flammula alnicola]|nr:Alpha/Beta hydrolase protein [Flammula alnicola]
MPTVGVKQDITFHYTDSGPLQQAEYTTLVVVHGHSFHEGIFQRLLPLASAHSLRVICVSRREYQGSTPYTSEELTVINNGSNEERAKFLQNQGVLLALFVDAVIQKHSLPKQGGVALAGWSLGNAFTLSMIAAIYDLPTDTKERLKSFLHSLILWDPPLMALGMSYPPGAYIPLWDENIPPEGRGAVFGKWIAGYFNHENLASRDFSQLNLGDFDTISRTPTTEKMTHDELLSVTDFAPGPKCETPLIVPGLFTTVLADQLSRALFDPNIRAAWGGLEVCNMYAESTVWCIVYATWLLEARAKDAEITFKAVKDANHFLMWEDPERTMMFLKECIRGRSL